MGHADLDLASVRDASADCHRVDIPQFLFHPMPGRVELCHA